MFGYVIEIVEMVFLKTHLHRFPITYTAGRRKKTDEGFEATKATEILLRSLDG